MDNPYRLSGQSAHQYLGGPILVAVGITLEADMGRVSPDDPRIVLAVHDCHDAIADVFANALDAIETGRSYHDFDSAMDELSGVISYFVSQSLRSYGVDPLQNVPLAGKLSASLLYGGIARWL